MLAVGDVQRVLDADAVSVAGCVRADVGDASIVGLPVREDVTVALFVPAGEALLSSLALFEAVAVPVSVPLA